MTFEFKQAQGPSKEETDFIDSEIEKYCKERGVTPKELDEEEFDALLDNAMNKFAREYTEPK